MYIDADPKTGTFRVEVSVNDRTAIFKVKPTSLDTNCLSLDMKEMVSRGMEFTAGHLSSFHHKFSLDALTNKAMKKVVGPYSLLLKFVDLGVIAGTEVKTIIQALNLQEQAKAEIGF